MVIKLMQVLILLLLCQPLVCEENPLPDPVIDEKEKAIVWDFTVTFPDTIVFGGEVPYVNNKPVPGFDVFKATERRIEFKNPGPGYFKAAFTDNSKENMPGLTHYALENGFVIYVNQSGVGSSTITYYPGWLTVRVLFYPADPGDLQMYYTALVPKKTGELSENDKKRQALGMTILPDPKKIIEKREAELQNKSLLASIGSKLLDIVQIILNKDVTAFMEVTKSNITDMFKSGKPLPKYQTLPEKKADKRLNSYTMRKKEVMENLYETAFKGGEIIIKKALDKAAFLVDLVDFTKEGAKALAEKNQYTPDEKEAAKINRLATAVGIDNPLTATLYYHVSEAEQKEAKGFRIYTNMLVSMVDSVANKAAAQVKPVQWLLGALGNNKRRQDAEALRALYDRVAAKAKKYKAQGLPFGSIKHRVKEEYLGFGSSTDEQISSNATTRGVQTSEQGFYNGKQAGSLLKTQNFDTQVDIILDLMKKMGELPKY